MSARNRSLFIVMGVSLAIAHSAHAQKDQPLAGNQIRIAENIETSIVSEPLDDRVNTPFIEYGPTLTKDGKRLYFSRQGFAGNTGGAKDEDIWFSEFDRASQNWKNSVNIGFPLNNAGPNFISGVGVDGDTLLLGNVYSKSGKMKAGLSISVRTGDAWSFPTPVQIENNYNFSDRTSFDLSNDRRALLIAQNKIDSKGGLDLYVAFRDKDPKNKYSGKESINLGPIINSAGDETSPFLAYDNKTLYFASKGLNGYGGYDIFVSKRLDDTWQNWTKPENLGPGINTAYDDTFFGFTPRSRYAYYSRGLTPANSDIYRIDMTYLFKPSSKPLNQMDELLDQAQIGQSLVLDSIFDNDSYEIKKSALRKLEYITEYLKTYQNFVVLITAHSNKHDSRDISQVLSDARAVKMRDYLISKGVDAKRLEYQGYGQDILVNMDNLPTLKSMKNRVASSVEFRLVGFVVAPHANFR
jgi:outer membrane protein OmpA-like peptidoglycan-associated protein